MELSTEEKRRSSWKLLIACILSLILGLYLRGLGENNTDKMQSPIPVVAAPAPILAPPPPPETPFQMLIDRAAAGDIAAEDQVGSDFLNGNDGATKDYDVAANWYEKASAKHDPVAISQIAFMYYSGYHYPKDEAVACSLFRKSAALGDSYAQYSLGNMLFNGDGCNVDKAQGKQWMQKAAAQKYPGAQDFLQSVSKLEGTANAVKMCAAQVRQQSNAQYAGLGLVSQFDAYLVNGTVSYYGNKQEMFEFQKCMADNGSSLNVYASPN